MENLIDAPDAPKIILKNTKTGEIKVEDKEKAEFYLKMPETPFVEMGIEILEKNEILDKDIIKHEKKEIEKEWTRLWDMLTKNYGGDKKSLRWQCADLFYKTREIYATKKGEVFLYHNKKGIYVEGEKYLKNELSTYLCEGVTSHDLNEIIEYIKNKSFTESFQEEKKELLCVKNGVIDIFLDPPENFYPHEPTFHFLQQIPVEYNPDAECPQIEEFLEEIVEKKDVEILKEIAGYCLWRGYPIHKAFMLVGDGANGKSTFLNLLKTFLGTENCTSISLQALNSEQNRFSTASLSGKLANIYPDLPSFALASTGKFKILTGGDLVGGEEKFREKFVFENYCKLIFSCNQLPRTEDTTRAYFRRWVIINFPYVFEEENADPHLLKKITTPTELSGLLNEALKSFRWIYGRGNFSNSYSSEETQEKYIKMSDSVGAFVMEKVEPSPSEWIEKRKLYNYYCEYCRTEGYPMISEGTFGRRLPQFFRVEDYRPEIENKRVNSWRGLKIKNEINEVN